MPTVTVKVKDIDWTTHTFAIDSDAPKSIVDLAEENGVELPYSCRSGACFTCCGEIQKGEQRIDHNKTWEQLIDVEPGETLCCISWVCSEAFDTESDKEIAIDMLN